MFIFSLVRYGYAVQDDIGNDFNKQETSDGGTVQGQYRYDNHGLNISNTIMDLIKNISASSSLTAEFRL